MKTQSVFITKTYLMLFLLFAFYCIAEENKIEEQRIQFTNGQSTFSGTLFLPEGDGIYPAVVILQGGSSNVKAQRSTSTYYAQKFIQKGIAALMYDKRGTGDSGGDFSQTTFDDLITDAINAIQFLKKQNKINPQQIGVFGPSQGGRIAAMAAARSHDVAFVTSISAPLVSIADLCYFSSMHFIKQMGITDSLKNLVDPLWIKHYSFVEKGDVKGLKKLDLEIEKLYTNVDSIFLPLTSDKHDHLKDFRLGDFQPQYNSMTRDYISELSKIKVPWLNIYAECDEAVPVEPSIEIMKKQMRIGGNNKHKIKVIPDLNHGFRHVETKEYFPVEDVVIEWILKIVAPSHRLTAAEVERLFVKPACLKSFSEDSEWSRIEDFPVQSKGITLSAKLYLPEGKGPWPAVIIVPGGFNETELILRSPRVQAPRFAHCGFAAVVFYKRGTGLSGGCYAEATYDDFIDDVGNIAKQLARRQDIDRFRVGASGGSGGGFVGSISAARYQEISFMINKSGPIVPMEEENDFNIAYALRFRGYADSLVEQVLPLWKEHHAAWAQADTAALRKIATEIKAKRERYDPFLLPTPYDEVFEDSNLVFLWPKFRSASRDYLSEMKTMQCKYLSIYGENDPIVPVTSCVRNIVRLMKESKNDDYEILVIPEVEHSFIYPGTRKQVPVIHRVIEWLNQNVK